MFQMLSEFQQEAATTKRLLERLPDDRLSWKPHPKSMSLGQLAIHIASIPAGMCRMAQLDGFDLASPAPSPPDPASREEVLATFEKSVQAASEYIGAMTPEAASGAWRLSANGKEIFTIPRAGMLRTMMLNHWYHHRGQLSVYLRILDVPIPIIYGRSADENLLG